MAGKITRLEARINAHQEPRLWISRQRSASQHIGIILINRLVLEARAGQRREATGAIMVS